MKNRKQYLTVTETTDKAFIALGIENLTIPTWKIDYIIDRLNEIMYWAVDMGEDYESFFKKLMPGLKKIDINIKNETIGIVCVINDDRVIGTLYYGEAKDYMVDIFNSVDKI